MSLFERANFIYPWIPDYMADEGGKSDQQLLHGAEKYVPFLILVH